MEALAMLTVVIWLLGIWLLAITVPIAISIVLNVLHFIFVGIWENDTSSKTKRIRDGRMVL